MIRPLIIVDLNPHGYPLTAELEANLKHLLTLINALQQAYGKQFIVTSGLRSDTQQQALIAAGKSHASKSKHLTGQAVDLYDADNQLKSWITNNLPLTEGLWFEAFTSTPNWVHMQCIPPVSQHKFFIP